MIELRAIFHGRVQGVGFRQTALKLARAMDLKGYVRNQIDGTVELIAQGERRQLEQLLEGLNQTFGARLVDRTDLDFHPPKQSFKEFIIST